MFSDSSWSQGTPLLLVDVPGQSIETINYLYSSIYFKGLKQSGLHKLHAQLGLCTKQKFVHGIDSSV